ncbi:putative 2OG-Fe(II) oxygenase [Novosphingobium sp. PhB165]|uniref:2OG-Fe(II) oxygenase family protein n=1 Tax=Novosphingobium sp. PhB165 TaxID=2485105 RepID=UPI0014050D69|nr:putative 2OG-Fe(II) oxygenase [Novosphingobium sp. PhB165]
MAADRDDPETLAELAGQALAQGREEEAEERLSRYLRSHAPDPALLHWTAMLRRALDRRGEAIAALEQGLRHDPANAGMVHALAHLRLEAGLQASAQFEQATRLAPAKAEIRLGLASARYAEGEGARGLSELEAMLAANPGWMEGHRQFAQLATLMGQGMRALATVEAALARFPQSDALRGLAVDLLLAGEHFGPALTVADRALAVHGPLARFQLARAAALDELGRSQEAAAQFAALGNPTEQGHAVWWVRHLLRTGRYAEAAEAIEPWLTAPGAEGMWPYAALAWRLTGDPRSEWLDGQQGRCRVIDLDPEEIGLADLRAFLGRLHGRSGRFLDQSVRGGTQTDGALLARIEPEVVRLRDVLRREVARFAQSLPAPDAGHPMLSQPRPARPRFAGSWSVRLAGAGFHTAHHHPQGWISSALYITVPEGLAEGQGHLDLGGAPAALGIELAPRLTVAPRPARLVLFPSWMWHGTRPFPSGERMTVAFDVARAQPA